MVNRIFERIEGRPGGPQIQEEISRGSSVFHLDSANFFELGPVRGKGVLWVNFLQICSSPRSAADYIEISKEFHTVILSDVPIINSDDEARRFISFIDECYDRKVKLIISAAELPEKLYVKSRLEEKFKRTISRMTEMQSKDYLSQAHLA